MLGFVTLGEAALGEEVASTGAVFPSLFTNTNTFPTATLTLYLLPSLVTNSQTFYTPEVIRGFVLEPGLSTNTSSFYTPQINLILYPSKATNTSSFFSPTIVLPPYILLPSVVTNSQTFYTPSLLSSYPLYAPPWSVSHGAYIPQQFFSPTVKRLSPLGDGNRRLMIRNGRATFFHND